MSDLLQLFSELAIPTDFSTLSDAELSGLDEQARAAAAPLIDATRTDPASLTDTDLDALEKLGAVVTQVTDERQRRIAQAATTTATTARAQSAASVFAAEGEKTTGTAGTDDSTAASGEGEDVTKAPGVADVAAQTGGPAAPVVPAETAPARESYARVVAAAGLPGVNAGHEFTSVDEMAKALDEQMATYSGIGPNQYVKTPGLQIRRNFPAEQRIGAHDDHETIARKLDAAANESALPGGSLVAAAGWCAPSQVLYDLFELEDANAGMVDIPEIQVSRGGINFTVGPDFSTIWGTSGINFHQTEAQVIAATSKTCVAIPCPSFTDVRLEVEGVCITGSFLQDRGYPEMVARWVRGVMAVHSHKLNAFKLSKMASGSTAVTYADAASFGGANTVGNDDLTVASRLLAVIEMQIVDYRYKHRMAPTATLEVVLPWWVKAQIRADVQRRGYTSAQEAFTVTDAMIDEWFRIRGARPQYVYDWQDAFSGGAVGGASAPEALPLSVQAMIYAAGTWVAGVADVIRLDTVYDSTNLALNQYTQLFTEEGILVAKRGFDSRIVTVPIDPTGITALAVAMTSAA